MSTFRFIHTADLHLDTPFKGLVHIPKHLHQQIQQSTFRAFDQIIDYCIKYQVDFLLISGDVFDVEEHSLKALLHFYQGLKKLDEHGIQSYIIHGNHDPADQIKSSFDWPKSVHFFPSDKVEVYSFIKEQKELVRIYGRSFPTKSFRENIVPEYKKKESAEGIFHIGLLHTNLDGNPEHDTYAPTTTQELLYSDMDYWALGHIHKKHVVSNSTPVIVYPGNPQGRHMKETGTKGCVLVEVDRQKVQTMKWIETSQIKWDEVVIDITSIENMNRLMDHIQEKIDGMMQTSQVPMIIRISLIGESDLHFELHEDGKKDEMVEILNQNYIVQSQWTWIESIQLKTTPYFQIEDYLEKGSFLVDYLEQLTLAKEQMDVTVIEKELGHELFKNRSLKNHFTSFSNEDIDNIFEKAKHLAIHFFTREERNS
ncbi:MAG: exonuclease SbcCD subunit D [Tepidibacillus sp.]